MNIFKSFHVSLAKKKELELTQNIGSSSNFKMAPAPAKKPRLRNTGLNSYCSVLVTIEFVSYISKNIHLTYKIYLMFYDFLWSDPDPIPYNLTGSGSGSDQQVRIRPDPDPQHCLYCKKLINLVPSIN